MGVQNWSTENNKLSKIGLLNVQKWSNLLLIYTHIILLIEKSIYLRKDFYGENSFGSFS